jgi:23S rRNA pseudouridine1911/1915/1917 synthase
VNESLNPTAHPRHLVVDQAGERLDRWLAGQLPDRSRAEIQRWIKESRVTANGVVIKASYRTQLDDHIMVDVPDPVVTEVGAEDIPLHIVYEDGDLLVIDKAAGQVVHPAPGHSTGTLVNAILHHVPDLAGVGGELRPGIVHRLDKDTSGLLLVAKNDRAHRALQQQFKARTVHKVYLALLEGILTPRQGTIDAPIGRDPRQRQRMAVMVQPGSKQARPATTRYLVQTYFDDYTLVEAELLTGRTHQIRVHFQFIGFPLVGDRVYGRRKQRLACPRQFLHAQRLGFQLPSTGEQVEFFSPLPPDLQAVLDRLAG